MAIARLLPLLLVLAAPTAFAQRPPAQSTLARVVCSSQERGYEFCEVETRYGVRLTRQISRARCVEGSTWGYDRRGIWVDAGCAAEFEVGDPGHGGTSEVAGYPVRPGETVGVPGDLFTCESRDGRRRQCSADLRGLDLSTCIFRDADLTRADMRYAVLRTVDLLGARPVGVRLDGADLRGAHIGPALWRSAELDHTRIEQSQAIGYARAHGLDIDEPDRR